MLRYRMVVCGPQIDTVHADLTVRENLAYAAALKLPPNVTKQMRTQANYYHHD